MSKVLIEEQTLYDIGDAIRNENGLSTLYKPSEMANAIAGLVYEDIHFAYDNAAPNSAYGHNGDVYCLCDRYLGTGLRIVSHDGISGSGRSDQNILGYTFTALRDFQITKLALRTRSFSNDSRITYFRLTHNGDIIYETPDGVNVTYDGMGLGLHVLDNPISLTNGEQYTITGCCGGSGYYTGINNENTSGPLSTYIRIDNGVYASISASSLDQFHSTSLHTDSSNAYSCDIYVPDHDTTVLPPTKIYYKSDGSWTLYSK